MLGNKKNKGEKMRFHGPARFGPKKRMSEISKVESIVEESLEELKAWFTIKEGLPVLTELKEELSTLKNEALVKFSYCSSSNLFFCVFEINARKLYIY